jgi:ubiquitin-conjugating enzyme E2 variant
MAFSVASTGANLACAVLLADFVSGLVHWAEDAYARFKPVRKVPLINTIALENDLHHRRPREFLGRSWWASSWDLALLGTLVVLAACLLDRMSAAVLLFALLAANANQFHKWTHRNPRENHWFVTVLQRLYLLQTPRHHGRHHQGEKNTHYCVVTNFLNPLLEEVGFWRRLERLVARLCRRSAAPSR